MVLGFHGRIFKNNHSAVALSTKPTTNTRLYDTGSRMYLNSSSKRQLELNTEMNVVDWLCSPGLLMTVSMVMQLLVDALLSQQVTKPVKEEETLRYKEV